MTIYTIIIIILYSKHEVINLKTVMQLHDKEAS